MFKRESVFGCAERGLQPAAPSESREVQCPHFDETEINDRFCTLRRRQSIAFLMLANSVIQFLDGVHMTSNEITAFVAMTPATVFKEPTSTGWCVGLDTTWSKTFLRTMLCGWSRLSERLFIQKKPNFIESAELNRLARSRGITHCRRT